jgi:CxxC-x17-CxxC domain-containing protein
MDSLNLPEIPINKDLTYLGLTTYRDKNTLFGIKRKDRRQHVYILGKSGTGKSVLMFNMIIQNIKNGEGVCVVDPHGELVEAVLSAIPPHRLKDAVYFNPADTEYHVGFNVLELIDPQYKHLVASGLMGIFTKIWANAWSARMEYILNNTILALLDTPGSTLLGIPRMLVDKDYRQKIISNLKDPVIKAFWVHEYEAWQDKFRNEAIAPIQNKVGQFLATSIIRNVVGQSISTINIFDIMNDGKIFLVNVAKGRIGEDNSGLLGGMIITKIQLAAMERVRIPEEHRKDFYLYVDEFQNFVTDAFAGILSEARKYRLNLTVAHQYTAQLKVGVNTAVRDAVFGNAGTMIVFRVGSDDAEFLESEFDPEFTPQDIVNLPNYKIYLKLMIDGVTSRPFSAKTLPPMVKSGDKKVEEEVIKSSRALYCRPKEVVEREINDWSGMSLGNENESSSSSVEKFPAICSLCKKETTVPFKPEPGRAVYCKDCIARIKSGEVKVEKKGQDQINYDETKFYKPLADLGIEFTQKDRGKVEEERYTERVDKHSVVKPGIFSTIKKVFVAKKKDNSALREVLNKTISLDSLKDKISALGGSAPGGKASKDRAASAEEMNKLKELISEKIPNQEKAEKKITTPAEAPPPQKGGEETPKKPAKEVPEDVLRKILE